ncbi:MAG: glycosyltransferase family 39 protein [Candidatus Babeliales bacterium]|jgi:4-amino-4-deoxy-L-arabinose transferase-like glycosyltransferase
MVGLASTKHRNIFLLSIFVFSLIIRFIFFKAFLANNPIKLGYDSGHYHAVAYSIVQGNGVSNPDGSPHFYRLPGYPLFLATCYSMFGINTDRALMTQLVLSSCIPLLVYVLALQLFPGVYAVAYVSTFLTALHPGFLILSGLVMSETPFIVFLLAFLILFFISWHSARKFLWTSGAGLMLGFASLVRPVGTWLMIICLITLAVQNYRWATSIKQILIFMGAWFIPVGLWLLRNFCITGLFFLSTFSGAHLLNHGAVRVTASAYHISYIEAQKMVHDELAQRVTSSSEIVWAYEAEHYARARLMLYPWQTFKLCVINIIKTVCSLYAAELLCIDAGGVLPSYDATRSYKDIIGRFIGPSVHNRLIIPLIYAEIFLQLIILLGVLGWVVAGVRRKLCILPQHIFVIMMMGTFVSLSCLCGFARLRLPVEPFFIMLSVSFWSSVGTERE